MFGYQGFSILAISTAALTVPLHTPLGLFWLDPAATLLDPVPIDVPRAGIGMRPLRVPTTPSLRNRTLFMQALHVAPSRAWVRFTNLARLTLF
jgi:hypothetical protein